MIAVPIKINVICFNINDQDKKDFLQLELKNILLQSQNKLICDIKNKEN